MVDTSQIHQLIARGRRRLRLQAALETATTASVLAFALALAAVYAVRQEAVSETTGLALLLGCLGLVAAGALVGALRRVPTHIVATRIDRASNLADRLSSACAFEEQLDRVPDPQTTAFMHAAIRDAVTAVPGADVPSATPFRIPADSRAAAVFAVVTTLVAGLYWPHDSEASSTIRSPTAELRPGDGDEHTDHFEEDDLDYARDLVEDLRRVAQAEREPHLEEFVLEVERLLAKAELGELSKEKLLEELAKAEQRYMEGADEDMQETLSDLQRTGKELEKHPLTREIGKALKKGDLEQARQEMEKLAQKIENGELSDKQEKQVAKALDKAADKFQKRDQQREQKADKEIAQKQDEIRKLQRKLDQAQNERDKRRLAQKLDKKKRELKKLQRNKEQRQKSARKRSLKQLHRDMKQASQQLQQGGQQNRRMASRSLRKASENTGKVDADRRKMATQKRVASQLTDLEEAMRRARRRGNRGPKSLFGKNKRNQDFRRRARGQQGQRGAWRPGQGQKGPGQQGKQPGGKGKQPGGQSYGDQHDPYLLGDSTPKSGNTKDQSISGLHGRGPSQRETILSAAQKGFASGAYKKVYGKYKEKSEEVMRSEKVPSGYKYYVKRYFQKIKPHSMD